MRAAVIAFSPSGMALAERVAALEDCEIGLYAAERHARGSGFEPFSSVRGLTAALFGAADALVFIGACGIAVRAIAPHVQSKLSDPAVVAVDETGRFAVSLLSGHAGGANRLAERIAMLIGATAVITTASDSHAAARGEEAARNLVLGVGCRRGLAAETIERTVTILLWDAKIPLARVAEAATIDVKRDDAGLVGFAEAHGLPLCFYTAEELASVPGVFSRSERVLEAVGVDNVCERAAVLCGGKGRLILRKTAKNGVTAAVFEKE